MHSDKQQIVVPLKAAPTIVLTLSFLVVREIMNMFVYYSSPLEVIGGAAAIMSLCICIYDARSLDEACGQLTNLIDELTGYDDSDSEEESKNDSE